MKLNIEEIQEDPVKNSEVEIVERKGLGHPDTLCDSVAHHVSKALCSEYKKKFGKVLHHNTDEVQLVAGSSKPKLGGGKIEEKIYILLAGRATKEYEGVEIDVDKIAIQAAKNYIKESFKELKTSHIEFESRIGETSDDLKNVYENEKVLSNDTSFGVGHHPLSDAEKLAIKLEEEVRQLHEAGEDIKVMIYREGDSVDVTVAVAGISKRIKDLQHYKRFLKKTRKLVFRESEKLFSDVDVKVNSADNLEKKKIYITTTGTSAENGDDGSVGRGNRYNGLITPMRPMSLEAHSGKNPVNHVGRINQERANKIAINSSLETEGFCRVYILNKIGEPVEEPIIHLQVSNETERIREKVKEAF